MWVVQRRQTSEVGIARHCGHRHDAGGSLIATRGHNYQHRYLCRVNAKGHKTGSINRAGLLYCCETSKLGFRTKKEADEWPKTEPQDAYLCKYCKLWLNRNRARHKHNQRVNYRRNKAQRELEECDLIAT